MLNLDNQTKDFITQMVRSNLSNPVPQILEPDSTGEFGVNTNSIALSAEQVSAVISSGVSGTINLNFPSSGVFFTIFKQFFLCFEVISTI